MAGLVPDVNFNTGTPSPIFNQPTQRSGSGQRLFETGVSLFLEGEAQRQDQLAKETSSNQPTAGQLADIEDEALYRQFGHELSLAQALRREGRDAEADAKESRVMTEFLIRGGDPSSARTQGLITQITGRPEGFTVGFSEAEVMQQKVMESPEFQTFRMGTYATHPDATEDQRTQIALNQMSLQEANERQIEAAQYEWHNGAAQGYVSTIQNFSGQLMGGLAVLQQNGRPLSNADVQEARLQFNQFLLNPMLSRPTTATDADWKVVQDEIDKVDRALSYWEDVTSKENIDSQLALNLFKAVSESEDFNYMEKNVLGRMLMSDPALFKDMGILEGSELFAKLDNLMLTAPMTDADLRDPSRMPSGTISDDPVKVFTDGRDKLQVSQLAGQSLGSNPELRNEWAQGVSSGLASIEALSQEGQWMSASDLESIFSPEYYSNLRQVMSSDPALGAAILERTKRTLTAQGASLGARLSSLTRDTGLVFNRDTNSFTVTRDSVQAILRDEEFQIVDKIVQEDFGGDYAAAHAFVRDNGGSINLESARDRNLLLLPQDVPPGAESLVQSIGRVTTLLEEANSYTPSSSSTDVMAPEVPVGSAEDYSNRIIGIESSGNPNAKNTNSTATGLGQFIESTWIDMMKRHKPELYNKLSRRDLLQLRLDPNLNREMTVKFTEENMSYLSSRGFDTTPGNVYLAHFLGPAGAAKALSANDSTTVEAAMGSSVTAANPFLKDWTIGQLKAWATRKMAGSTGGASSGPTVSQVPFTPSIDPVQQTQRPEVAAPEFTSSRVQAEPVGQRPPATATPILQEEGGNRVPTSEREAIVGETIAAAKAASQETVERLEAAAIESLRGKENIEAVPLYGSFRQLQTDIEDGKIDKDTVINYYGRIMKAGDVE